MRKFRIGAIALFIFCVFFHYGFNMFGRLLVDNSYPEITVKNKVITASINAEEKELLQGVTAYDKKDGDVTASIIVEKISEFDSDDRRTVTFAAFDSDGHISRAEALLEYTDYTPPKISLTSPLKYNIGTNSNFSEYFTCADCIDGDITHNINVTYDSAAAESAMYYGGAFDITATATNSCGDTVSVSTYVEVTQNTYENMVYTPQIILSDYIAYTQEGKKFDPREYLEGMTIGKDEYTFDGDGDNVIQRSKVSVDSNVNKSESGQYAVHFSYTAKNGYTGKTDLIVIVYR